MSDLNKLEQDIMQALTHIPYAAGLGIKPIVMGDEVTMMLPFSGEIIGNPMLKALHGGAVGAFMETTAIVQLLAVSGATAVPRPIGINIDYLRRGNPAHTYARAVIARQGSRVANVRVHAWQVSPDEPIAILHGHFLNGKA